VTSAEWLAREVAEQRLDAQPDSDVLAVAAAMIRARGVPARKQRKRRTGSAAR